MALSTNEGSVKVPEDQISCFVIMPFGETTKKHNKKYWTGHFEKFLKTIIEENQKLKASRSKPLRGDILKEMLTNLVSAPIVVADITDYNPNVFWELGVRQSYRSGTITIAEAGVVPPFDISNKGILYYYPNDYQKNEEFREDLKEALKDCLENPDKSDSCVKEALMGRGTFFEFFQLDETLRRLRAVMEEQRWNEIVLGECIQTAKKNQGKKLENCRIPSSRVRLAASELLLTNRYVDADESLYIQLGTYWAWFNALNQRIGDWKLDVANVGSWIIESEKGIRKESDFLLKNVKEIFDELIKILG